MQKYPCSLVQTPLFTMNKRRITKQQSTRIQKNQDAYQALSQTHDPFHLNQKGLVITRFGRHAEIETREKKRIHCSIRPNLDSIVAGDQIIWQKSGDDQGVIVSCCQRQSILGCPNNRGKYRPIAANISQLLIVVAPKPEINWTLLDSYLIMAELLKLDACIILNKIDLNCETIKQELLINYQPLGYQIVFTTQENKLGYNELKTRLKDHTSVFLGQSGVGKSSLISQILPHETISVAEISKSSELGCHTTSNSRLYHLPQGGSLIDSPGVRAFSLWKASSQDIVYGFREFKDLALQCKFRNCTHVNTPGCAIFDSIVKKTFSTKRYESLIKLLAH